MKKVCASCREDVRLADYYRDHRSRDGLMRICKACHKAAVRNNRRANALHYKAYELVRANLKHRVEARNAYAKTEAGKEASRRAKQKYIERNPLKRLAQVMAGNAIRDGRLLKRPCEACGTAKAQAHHDDYSKPLDVRWLCTTHHAEWHKHNTPLCPDQAAEPAPPFRSKT